MRSVKPTLVAALLSTTLGIFVAGCAQERHEVIPATATLGAEGEKRLTFTTNGPGTLYVHDQTDNSLVYSGEVLSERQITVDPERNEIMMDGRLVQDKKLERGHTHRIYFLPLLERDRI
jgi:hypothetical protein